MSGWFVFAILVGGSHPRFLASAEYSTRGWQFIVKRYQAAVGTGHYSDVGLVFVDEHLDTRRLDEGEII